MPSKLRKSKKIQKDDYKSTNLGNYIHPLRSQCYTRKCSFLQYQCKLHLHDKNFHRQCTHQCLNHKYGIYQTQSSLIRNMGKICIHIFKEKETSLFEINLRQRQQQGTLVTTSFFVWTCCASQNIQNIQFSENYVKLISDCPTPHIILLIT